MREITTDLLKHIEILLKATKTLNIKNIEYSGGDNKIIINLNKKKTLSEKAWVRGAFPQHDDEMHYAEEDVKISLKEYMEYLTKSWGYLAGMKEKAKEIFGDDLI